MKIKMILLSAFYLLLIPTIAFATFTVNSPEFKHVIAKLDMQGHADHEFSTCSVQQVYYQEVEEMLNEGKSEEDIVGYYVDQYGQSALREPDQSASGMIAWGMPAFAFLAGAMIVAYGIKKLTRHSKTLPEEAQHVSISDTEKEILSQTIEEERRKLF